DTEPGYRDATLRRQQCESAMRSAEQQNESRLQRDVGAPEQQGKKVGLAASRIPLDEKVAAYDELDLRVERGDGVAYRILATTSDGRTARGNFQRPISDDELDDFVQRVGLMRRRNRRDHERMEAIKSFGAKLFQSIINDDVRN